MAGRHHYRTLFELFPLLAFFIANWFYGLLAGAAVLMVASSVAVVLCWRLERQWPVMPTVAAAFALVFGGLSLVFQDSVLFQIKPTVANLFFAVSLLVCRWLGRPVLKSLLGHAIQLTPAGWRRLSDRWTIFFLAMALVNETAWRTLSVDQWVALKTFGFPALTLVFAVLQTGLVLRHAPETVEGSGRGDG